jgi:hypothetical protein
MKEARMLRVLLAAVVLGMIVTPIAVAGAQGQPAGKRSPQKIALKLLRGLKKEAAAITAEVASLHAQISTLEAPKQAPPSAPSGLAGGDLSGNYPNPTVRPSSITSAKIAEETVTSADIAPHTIRSLNIEDGSIGSADITDQSIAGVDLGPLSVGASQLLETHVVTAGPTAVGNNSSGEEFATCPSGERLLSGGAEWDSNRTNLWFTFSRPDLSNPNRWDVLAHNTSGVTIPFFVYALCLRAG